MLAGGINVFVPKNVCYQVDVPGLLIEGCAVGTSKFVRGDPLGSGHAGCVFFYQILYRAHIHPFPLGGIEESVLMSGDGGDPLADG